MFRKEKFVVTLIRQCLTQTTFMSNICSEEDEGIIGGRDGGGASGKFGLLKICSCVGQVLGVIAGEKSNSTYCI